MFLPWLNVSVQTVSELLWFLQVSPPVKEEVDAKASPESWKVLTRRLRSSNNQDGASLAGTSPDENSVQLRGGSSLPPEVTTVKRPPPTLFALIIGIGDYKDPEISNLGGTIPDAKAVQSFLSKIGVTNDRIIVLFDKDATREAIKKAIRGLAHNPAINKDDPILIYYAGHGAQAPSPSSVWATSSSSGFIQMLLPYDFKLRGSDSREGQGLFDVVFSQLLAEIAKNKSDNITVILDSCHSGSSTRKRRGDETLATRGVKLPPDYTIPQHVLRSEFEERGSSVAPGYEKTGLRSHTLLAACKQDQQAYERNGRGAFTSALLKLVEKDGVDKLTYGEAITRLEDLPGQNPQCEGENRNRILFNAKVSTPYRTLYCIQNKAGDYQLKGGEAHGLTEGMEFAIYPDDTLSHPPLGSVTVIETMAFTSKCSLVDGSAPGPLPKSARALQTHVGNGQDIRLHLPLDAALIDLFLLLGKEMQHKNPNNRSFRLVNSIDENPDIAITVTPDGLVRFRVMEEICKRYGLEYLPFDDVRVEETEYLFSILCSAADFYWNLHHSNKTKPDTLVRDITVECFKLVPSGKFTDDLEDILLPKPGSENLNVDGTIIIDVDEDVKYGYKITNNSENPLHAALLYFDVSDMSIRKLIHLSDADFKSYYSPGTAADGNVDISIPAKKSMTIGFGDSGTPPYKYFLRENQTVDVGFLKLCLSTELIDYTSVSQVSPFQTNRPLRGIKMATKSKSPKKRRLWHTVLIPVVQKRGAKSFGGRDNA